MWSSMTTSETRFLTGSGKGAPSILMSGFPPAVPWLGMSVLLPRLRSVQARQVAGLVHRRDVDAAARTDPQRVVDAVGLGQAAPVAHVLVLVPRDRLEAVALDHEVAPLGRQAAGRRVLLALLIWELGHGDVDG